MSGLCPGLHGGIPQTEGWPVQFPVGTCAWVAVSVLWGVMFLSLAVSLLGFLSKIKKKIHKIQ